MKENLFKGDTDFDEDDVGDEELPDEEEKINPLVAAGIFLGMIIVAALICVILWSVTHRGSEEEHLTNKTETFESEAVEDEASEEETAESSIMESEVVEEAQSSEATEVEPISGNESMEFAETADTVTSKDVTNLRSAPSTADAENVVGQLLNGETLSRTGVNENTGWSRVEFYGEVLYVVSSYVYNADVAD